MNIYSVSWLELTVLVPLAGAVAVALCRTDATRRRWGIAITGAALGCSLLAWIGHETGASPGGSAAWELFTRAFGFRLFALDGLSAPLLPLVALLHFLTVLATTGSNHTRWSVPLLLAGEAVQLAALGVRDPWPLTLFLALGVLPAYLDLRVRGMATRVYAIHAGLFVALLAAGAVLLGAGASPAVGCVPLLLAVFVRSGTAPFHLWVPDLFEKASFAVALLFVTPIIGVYMAVRLVLPVCPEWILQALGFVSLLTAILGAGLSIVQTDARRFFAYQFISHAAMVMVGLQLNTPISLTGALCLWFSVALSLAGQGLVLRALESRFGRITITGFRGLYEHSPPLAICFLLTGLGSVGFPGTLGFIAAELLAGGAVGANPLVGVVMIVAAALNGIAVVRVYFLLFTGGRHQTSVPLGITGRERFAVLVLAALILGGGLYPQPGVESRHHAAAVTLRDRQERLGSPVGAKHE